MRYNCLLLDPSVSIVVKKLLCTCHKSQSLYKVITPVESSLSYTEEVRLPESCTDSVQHTDICYQPHSVMVFVASVVPFY